MRIVYINWDRQPLMPAAESNLPEMCRLLLESNADIHDDDIDEYTKSKSFLSSDCRFIILAEIEHRCMHFHIEYPIYNNSIYSICYPDGNVKK